MNRRIANGRGLLNLFVIIISICLISTSHAQDSLEKYRTIVVAQNAPDSVQEAARDLQYHLTKITGRDFPIVFSKPAASEERSFYVGSGFWPEQDAQAATLGREGWMQARVPGGSLFTGGPDNLGARHAVSLFLEEVCGVRWLWPGESGEVIPSNPRLRVPQLQRSGAPELQRHYIKFYYSRFWEADRRKEQALWARRTRQNDLLKAGFGHAWASVIPREKYFESHPEWFSLVNGQRIKAQLCISNPQLRDEFVKNLLALPANQKLDVLSVSANDGYGFCECEMCRAKGDHNASYWDFVNDIATRVKKLRPELGIGTLAYTYSRQPPKNIERLPDNVYLSMTSYATQLLLPEGEEKYRDFVAEWKSKGVKFVIYEYWGMHYWLDLPVIYPRQIAQELKLAHTAGLSGAYGEGGKNFSTQAPNYYVLTRQLWNPQADPQVALNEFYAAFGPAAGEVREYFEIFEAATQRTWRAKNLSTAYVKTVSSYDEMFDVATLTQARTALERAEAKAANDAAIQKRLAFLRRGYEYTALMSELLGLYEKLGRSGFPLTFFEWQATAQAARRIFKNPHFAEGRDFFEERLKEPFSYTQAEKDEWLRRAWELGQKRIEMLNAARSDFTLDEGLYARTFETNGIPAWHETVAKYLGKPESEMIELQYTKPKPK